MQTKHITLLLIAAALSFSTIVSGQESKKSVVSSCSMIWDMVNNIAGDKIKSQLLVPIGSDPHLYDPTPVDAQKVASADLIFVNGLTFEGWITELIENSGTKAQTVTTTNGIIPITSGEYKNAYDPHAWMDVSLSEHYTKNILDGLISVAPEHADFFRNNHRTYAKRLMDLDAYITKKINSIPEQKRLLITSHDAFSYYGRRYGIRVEGIMGTSTESEAQTSDMQRVQKAITDSGVPAIFVESTINPKLLKQIAQDNDVAVGDPLFADSIGEKGSGGNSYYDMMKSNTDAIFKGLTREVATAHNHGTKGGSSWLPYLILGVVMVLGLILLIMKMNR